MEDFDMPCEAETAGYVNASAAIYAALTESFWLFAPNTHPVGRKIGFERFGEGSISLFSR